MALVVEDGSGQVDAQSYLSVADFKSFALTNYAVTDPVADDAIEQALRRASRYLDGRYRYRWLGIRTNGREQGLEWPRRGVVLSSPYTLPSSPYTYGYFPPVEWPALSWTIAEDEVPREVKDATAEAAIRELASPGSLTPDRTPARQVLQQTVGPITTVYANVAATRPIVTVIDEILAPLLNRTSAFSGSLVRA